MEQSTIFKMLCVMVLLTTSCSQQPKKTNLQIIDNICFRNIEGMREYLPEKFVDKLLQGNRVEIIRDSQDAGIKLEKSNYLSPKFCTINSKNIVGLSAPVNIENPDYVGGTLDVYFDNNQLLAAEFVVIKIP